MMCTADTTLVFAFMGFLLERCGCAASLLLPDTLTFDYIVQTLKHLRAPPRTSMQVQDTHSSTSPGYCRGLHHHQDHLEARLRSMQDIVAILETQTTKLVFIEVSTTLASHQHSFRPSKHSSNLLQGSATAVMQPASPLCPDTNPGWLKPKGSKVLI